VKNGKQALLLLITMRAVRYKHFVAKVMVGKKRLTILKITNKLRVLTWSLVAKAWTALAIIHRKTTKF